MLLADLIGLRERTPFVDDYINWLQSTIAAHPMSLKVRTCGAHMFHYSRMPHAEHTQRHHGRLVHTVTLLRQQCTVDKLCR
jgi:hypothetical protein